MDFAIGLVIFVLNLPNGQVLFCREIQITEGLLVINPANQKAKLHTETEYESQLITIL